MLYYSTANLLDGEKVCPLISHINKKHLKTRRILETEKISIILQRDGIITGDFLIPHLEHVAGLYHSTLSDDKAALNSKSQSLNP